MYRRTTDRILLHAVRAAAAIAGAVVVLIGVFLVIEALPSLRAVGPVRFVTDGAWRPLGGLFGLGPMVAGTLLVAGGALVIAVPLGLLAAIFSAHYAPRRLGKAVGHGLAIMAGIPSVVYGFWGLVVLVPLIADLRPPGPSLLAGILVLGLMILPMVALTAHAAIVEVPRSHLEGAAALGLTRWGTVRGVVLPAARTGIVTGVVLSVGRAIGETMAVLMVTGNVVQVPGSLFDPVRVLTANIALEMAYALEDHRAALFVTGLLLLAMVTVLVLAAEGLSRGGREARG